jgi:hypothetical protein
VEIIARNSLRPAITEKVLAPWLVWSSASNNAMSTYPIFHKIKGTKGTKSAAIACSSSKKWSSYKWDDANYFEISRKTNQLHQSSLTSNSAEYKNCKLLPE